MWEYPKSSGEPGPKKMYKNRQKTWKGKKNGFFSVHMRSEGAARIESIDEVLEVALQHMPVPDPDSDTDSRQSEAPDQGENESDIVRPH